jgi:hypothetical protein
MGKIFISYRRTDSEGEAGRLFDDLKSVFGDDHVFIDVEGIDPGKDFRKEIEVAVGACDVLIAVIGKKWLNAVDEAGKLRLDDPQDFVRLETAAALRRDITVIPVLVQRVEMPRSDQLPSELKALAWRNGFELRHDRWNVDIAELIKKLKKILPDNTTPTASPSSKTQESPGRLSLSNTLIAIFSLLIVVMTIFIFRYTWYVNVPFTVDPRSSEPSPIPEVDINKGEVVEVIPRNSDKWSCKGSADQNSPFSADNFVGYSGDDRFRKDENNMLPDAIFCSLIGRVGLGGEDGGKWHNLGNTSIFTADSSGSLYLTANDTRPEACNGQGKAQDKNICYSDNTGTITVTVRIKKNLLNYFYF